MDILIVLIVLSLSALLLFPPIWERASILMAGTYNAMENRLKACINTLTSMPRKDKAILDTTEAFRLHKSRDDRAISDGEHIHYGGHTYLKSDWINAARAFRDAFGRKVEQPQPSDYETPRAMYPEQ